MAKRLSINPAEKLAKGIIANNNNQLQSSTIDLPAHVESLLQSLGATTSDSGGKVTYYGDPITPAELGIFDRDYATKTAGSNVEHLYPDPDTFVVDTPMGRYSGVTEMIKMSKTPGEYKYPLTPLGSWQPSWL
jgi:hypothetical protein